MAVIASLRAKVESERWRLSVLGSVQGWQSFVTTWASLGGELYRYGQGEMCPPHLTGFDQQLEWSWDVAFPAVDTALQIIDARVPLSSAQCYHVFETLRGHALVFADGTVAQPVLDRIDRAVKTRELVDVMEYQSKAMQMQAMAAAAAKAAQAAKKNQTP